MAPGLFEKLPKPLHGIQPTRLQDHWYQRNHPHQLAQKRPGLIEKLLMKQEITDQIDELIKGIQISEDVAKELKSAVDSRKRLSGV
jgi:hypothetical protein